MRIGLDFRAAQKINSRRRGVGRFTRELTRALVAAPGDHEFLLYTLGSEPPGLPGTYQARPLAHLPKPSRLNWLLELWAFPRAARRDRLDLFHALDLLPMPVLQDCPVWVTVHDLIPWIFPEEAARRVPRDFRYALERALRRTESAELILTVSEHSRRDLCRFLGVPSERVAVIVEGCDESLGPVPPLVARQVVQEMLGVDGRYLLYVGGADYRKNLPVLLDWFRRVAGDGYPGKLVLAGESFREGDREAARLLDLAGKLGIRSRLLPAGFVPDGALAALYSACDFFVFPSLYEGFGLPVLEAMRCGAPVLASSSSAIPEVAGDAAFYFEPTCVEDMVEVFRSATARPELVEEKRRAGLKRAQGFTWQAAARQVQELYASRSGGKRFTP